MSIVVISIVVAVASIVGFVSYKILGPDNAVEEICEGVIKVETGQTVDLSPDSPAKTDTVVASTSTTDLQTLNV
jgi:hypothetical protein